MVTWHAEHHMVSEITYVIIVLEMVLNSFNQNSEVHFVKDLDVTKAGQQMTTYDILVQKYKYI